MTAIPGRTRRSPADRFSLRVDTRAVLVRVVLLVAVVGVGPVSMSTENRVAVPHDLNHVCRYGTHLVAMRDGRIVAEGEPVEVVTADLVDEVFGLACRVIDAPSHWPGNEVGGAAREHRLSRGVSEVPAMIGVPVPPTPRGVARAAHDHARVRRAGLRRPGLAR